MENKKSIKVLFAILLSSVMMFSIVATSSFATNTDTTDNNQKVITKAKAATCKVTLNANGGKIGTKTTKVSNVKKGSKIGKQLVTPKRSGYTFNGWYTKKTGGKKITKNTKVSKNVAYYAQWTKITESSKLLGHWRMETTKLSPLGYLDPVYCHLYFYADGKFQYFYADIGAEKIEGKYSVSNGKVIFTEMKLYGDPTTQNDMNTKTSNRDKFGNNYPKYQYPSGFLWNDKMTTEYKFGSDKKGNYLQITEPRNEDDYYTLESASKYYFTTNLNLP